MKKFIGLFIFCILASMPFASAQTQHISYTVDKIWGNGQHCAFTSIAEFKGKYYVTFREAQGHVFDSDGEARGNIRILVSEDGNKWETLPLIAKEGYDLRDPKLSVTPDGRLMVTLGGSIYRNQKLVDCQPHVFFSEDGKTFTEVKSLTGLEITKRIDGAAYVGYDALRGAYRFDVNGGDFGNNYYNAPNQVFTVNAAITADTYDRDIYVYTHTYSGCLESAVILVRYS